MAPQPEFKELGVVKIASPCKVSWSSMRGTDQVRFCGLCRLKVYDLSRMTANDARALFKRSEGKLCVRFYQRSDGSVLTADCPRGVARRTWTRRLSALLAGFVALFGVAYAKRQPVTERVARPQPHLRQMQGGAQFNGPY